MPAALCNPARPLAEEPLAGRLAKHSRMEMYANMVGKLVRVEFSDIMYNICVRACKV